MYGNATSLLISNIFYLALKNIWSLRVNMGLLFSQSMPVEVLSGQLVSLTDAAQRSGKFYTGSMDCHASLLCVCAVIIASLHGSHKAGIHIRVYLESSPSALSGQSCMKQMREQKCSRSWFETQRIVRSGNPREGKRLRVSHGPNHIVSCTIIMLDLKQFGRVLRLYLQDACPRASLSFCTVAISTRP